MNELTDERELRVLVSRVTGKNAAALELDDDLVRELGLDSLGVLGLLAAVERRFGARFPDEELGQIRSMRRMLLQIQRDKKEVS